MSDTPPAAQLVNGVYFLPSSVVSGTGIYTPVLAVGSNTGTESGYNGSTNTGLDTSDPKTNGLQIGQLQLVHVGAGQLTAGGLTVAAGDYYVFRLDLNEPTPEAGITLNAFRLFSGPDAGAGLDFATGTPTGFTLDFALGQSVNLTAWANGSGGDDYAIYVPVADVSGAGNLTVYMSFTNAQGGFEELKAISTTAPVSPPPPPPPPPVPPVHPALALDHIEVSYDGGTHFQAYDPATTPSDLADHGAPVFAYYVKNTGDVALTGVTVTDSFGADTASFDIGVGATQVIKTTESWAAGLNTDAFDAHWTYGGDSGDVTAAAAYFGAQPHLVLDKVEVSYDGGTTFQAYDPSTTPSDLAAHGAPVFAYTVKNDGNVDLTHVTVTDSFGADTGAFDIAAGASQVVKTTETWASGLHTDSFDAHFSYTDTGGDTAAGDVLSGAAYTGIAPGLTADLQVSTDGGANWADVGAGNLSDNTFLNTGSPVQFRILLTNTGNAEESVSADGALDGGAATGFTFGGAASTTLAAGASVTSDVITVTALHGVHTEVATATATMTDGHDTQTAGAGDSANYDGFSEGRAGLSIGYWSNHTSAAVWNKVGGQDGVLLNAGGTATLFIPKAAAILLLSSSTAANDARQLLLSQAIGAQLNINAGETAPAGLMETAVKWLTAGGGNVDGVTANGVLDSSEYAISTVKGSQMITLLGTKLASSGAAWSSAYVPVTTADHGVITVDGEGIKNALMAFDQNQLVTDPLGGVAYNASGAVGGTTSLWSVNGSNDYLWVLKQSHLFDGHGII